MNYGLLDTKKSQVASNANLNIIKTEIKQKVNFHKKNKFHSLKKFQYTN